MTLLVYTAMLGSIDQIVPPVPQTGVDLDVRVFTDLDFPPRPRAMTRRLQARIPKIFGWDLALGYDAYLWIDGSLAMTRPDAAAWFLSQLGSHDICVFRHPWRMTLQEEIDFVRAKMASGSRYLLSRYEGEDLDGLERYLVREHLTALPLFASGAFIYRPTPAIQAACQAWWNLTARYHALDQIQLSVALHQCACATHVIDEDIYHASHLSWIGHRRG
jgi:hypothetical protein